MKNLHKWLMLGVLLVSQISVQATVQVDEDESKSKWKLVKKKLKEIVPIDAEMFKFCIEEPIEGQDDLRLTDKDMSLSIGEFIRPHYEKMEILRLGKKASKVFDFKDQCLTDSGAISLACLFDSVKNVAGIDICHNQIESLGIQAIFTKACGDYVIKSRGYEIPFIFRFTASEDIKPYLEAIALKHNKSLSWKSQVHFSENRFDFQVNIEDKNPESRFKPNADFQQSLKDNTELLNDEKFAAMVKHFIRPYLSIMPKDDSEFIDCRDQDLTDWSAISFACVFDYLKDTICLDISHTRIEELGIKVILTKIFTSKDKFGFLFTASKDIKEKIHELASKYNKSLIWSEETPWKEDLYDYKLIIDNKKN